MKTVEITYRYQPDHEDARPRPRDAEGAQRRLDGGNASFAALLDQFTEGSGVVRRVIAVDPRDFGTAGGARAPVQQPYAAVLGCSDARVPVELIFSEAPNTALTAYTLQHALGDRAADAPQASYGVYVISTRRIWAPRAGSDDCDGLARPPADAAGFAHLAAAVIRSSRLRELLGEGEADAATSAARARG